MSIFLPIPYYFNYCSFIVCFEVELLQSSSFVLLLQYFLYFHKCYSFLQYYSLLTIINYSFHAVCYILMTYLFYNWKFISFDFLHSFLPNSHHPPLATTSLFSASMSLFFFFLLLDSTYKLDHTVFVFFCVTYFS